MSDQRNVVRARPRTWRMLAGEHHIVDDDDRQWPIWLMIIGLFAMIVAFWWVSAVVLVTYWTVGRLFCAFAFTGDLCYGGWVRRTFAMSRSYWFMFNLLAVGPFLFCAFFGINALFAGEPRTYAVDLRYPAPDHKRYWIEHGELPQDLIPLNDRSATEVERMLSTGHLAILQVSDGAFGFPVMGLQRPYRSR